MPPHNVTGQYCLVIDRRVLGIGLLDLDINWNFGTGIRDFSIVLRKVKLLRTESVRSDFIVTLPALLHNAQQ